MINDLISIIEQVKHQVTDDSDTVYSRYDSPKEMRDDLSSCLEQVQAGNRAGLEKLDILFAPTGKIQEHSVSNGWGEEYIKLSAKFDRVYAVLKKQL